MVYCGKPSMGCTTCRTRRIKCDETKPVCNQCIKSRRHCSGYRSDFDILHRDETQATARRAKKQELKKAAKRAAEHGETIIQFEAYQPEGQVKREVSPAGTASSVTSASPTSTTTPSFGTAHTSPLEITFPAVAAPPAMPLDQHASHYFAAHFIIVPGQAGRKIGHLDYLVPLLETENNPDSAFRLAYSACGLAAMSNREKAVNRDLVDVSFLQHSRAIRAVAESLQDPARCKTDATLAAVLLLCFFEKITASKEVGLLAWRTHIEGAIHIVQQRGHELRKNKYSTKLFNAVRLNIIARTLSSGTAPAMGANWWLRETEISDPAGVRFQRFCLEISDLRAEVTRLMATLPRTDDGLEIMLEMLRKIKNLDHQIATWTDGLPAEFQPQVLYYEDHRPPAAPQGQVGGGFEDAAVFPGPVYVYSDVVIASMRNGMRASRIILGSILVRVAAWICSPEDYRRSPDYVTAVHNMRACISDIVATTPFMLSTFGDEGSAGGELLRGGMTSGNYLCGTDVQAKMVGGLMASWPLSTVRTCDFTTDEQRAYAVGRLTYIDKGLGIKYASTLAGAKIRFPSMLIRRDGLMSTQDPLKDIKATLSIRPAQVAAH